MSRSRELWSTIAAGAVFVGGAGCGDEAQPSASCPELETTDRIEGWRHDLDCVERAVYDVHPDAFTVSSEPRFRAGMEALRDRVEEEDDTALLLELARLTASLGDAHTLVAFLDGFDLLPFHTFWFGEALHVVRVAPGLDALLGLEVVAIGGQPIDALRPRVAALISHELPARFDDLSPIYLASTRILHGLGAAALGAPVAVTFRDADGATEERTVDPVTGSVWVRLPDPSPAPPPHRRRADESYWFEVLPDQEIVYLAYNRAREDPARPFPGFAREVLDAVGSHRRLVVDLRHNPGGNSRVLEPLLDGIVARPTLNNPERLFVIVGRGTFSSAVLNADDLRDATRATLVGEPAGQAIGHFGEVSSLDLPFTGAVMTVSTRCIRCSEGGITLDIEAAPTLDAYLADRDPALEAILAR